MRHLFNTFLNGGEGAEKKWLEPLLAASIKDAPFRLRLSHGVVTKLLHALAKCLGEGIGLYGRGEGASKFRPWLEKNHKGKLYWYLSRIGKGTRQDSKTEGAFAAYWNRPLKAAYLQTARVGPAQRQPLRHALVARDRRDDARARRLPRQVHRAAPLFLCVDRPRRLELARHGAGVRGARSSSLAGAAYKQKRKTEYFHPTFFLSSRLYITSLLIRRTQVYP